MDDRDLHQDQFLAAFHHGELVGFGRIKKHKNCDEFCSLGVIHSKRHIGIAKELIKARIKIATQPIYLVTITPEFFTPLGFRIVSDYPKELQDKINYCTSELVVEETYVVMNYFKL